MAGIYIHIPFCKQACHYCNFHFSTSLKHKDGLIKALIKEISMRKSEWASFSFDTIYFGGGTPSLLSAADFNLIFNALYRDYNIQSDIECTIEANPDDISRDNIQEWKSMPINRVSLGIQSFYDDDLKPMNRSHSGAEAHKALDLLLQHDFQSISCDLIYGMPSLTDARFEQNISELTYRQVHHISAYALTVEKNTALDHFIKSGKVKSVDDQHQSNHFDILVNKLSSQGYDHYEISNFSKPGFHAKHNTSYWQGIPYAGFGPSAHGYLNQERTWNISNNAKYIASINTGIRPSESEKLSDKDLYNEIIMTGLRTKWGISKEKINKLPNKYIQHFKLSIGVYLEDNTIIESNSFYILSEKKRFFADGIASELFYID